MVSSGSKERSKWWAKATRALSSVPLTRTRHWRHTLPQEEKSVVDSRALSVDELSQLEEYLDSESEAVDSNGYADYSERRKKHVWKLARSWLNECLTEHTLPDACVHPIHSNYCPTRLIDIQGPNLSLVLRQDHEDPGAINYAALTYCWGRNMPESGLTKVATLETHRQGINLSKLPQTFRDAIEIARNLSVPYLWIDALCIIQDSNEDWEKEASAMSMVYSGAVITIAADVWDDCRGSFLQINRVEKSDPSYLKWDWNDVLNETPLMARGWTLQERELSPRIIYFTPTEILWECRMKRHREGVEPEEAKFGSKTAGLTRCLDRKDKYVPTDTDYDDAIFQSDFELRTRLWRQTITDYSSRSFTKIQDRLLAISGLAAEFQRLGDDQYVFGLWKTSLIADLGWAVCLNSGSHDGSNSSSLESASHAIEVSSRRITIPNNPLPTWSWVSINAKVEWPTYRTGGQRAFPHVPALKVLAAIVPTLNSSDDRPITKKPSIIVCGQLKELPLSDVPGTAINFDQGWPPSDRIFVLGLLVQPDVCMTGLVLVSTGQREEYERIGLAFWINPDWFENVEHEVITLV